MILTETKLEGAFLIQPEKLEDERGFFARAWCRKEFQANNLDAELVQCNISFSQKKGTLRGMHYQISPHQEVKLVRCTIGAIYDVIIDLRPESSSYLRWVGVELSADTRKMLYVPKGFAHGFQTLQDNTEVFYQVSEFYAPSSERGVRWDDPAFDIQWPDIDERVISERDRRHPDFASTVEVK